MFFRNFSLKTLMLVFAGVSLALCDVCAYMQEDYPQRIISLSPAVTEELYILGVEDKLVGCTVYCQRPPEAKEKQKVGTATVLNLEKAVSLQPDLVLASPLTDFKAIEKLKNLGIEVVDFSLAKNFNELCGQFLKLGEIVGKKKEAQEIVDIAKKRVNSLREKAKVLKKPKVFVQVGAKPLVAVSRDSFVNDFIELAGGINIVQGQSYTRYSREKVIKDNPDAIIIVTMGINGEEEKKTWQKFKTLSAVKSGKVYILGPDKITSPTPLTFADTLEEIAVFLHSELEERQE